MGKGSGNSASCLAEFSVCRWGPGTWRFHVGPTCGACVRLNLLTWLSLAGNLFGSSCISVIVCPCMSVYVHLRVCVCVCVPRSVVSDSDPLDCTPHPRLLRPPNSPGRNTGAVCHFLPGGISLTQGSNPGLLHCSQTLQMYVNIIYKQYI